MKKLLVAAIASMGTALLPASSASAGTATATLWVHATVEPYCSITVGYLEFGKVTSLPLSTNAGMNVTCPTDVIYHVTLDAGQHYANGYRNINDGPNNLQYEVYQPGTKTQWGDNDYDGTFGSGSSVVGAGTGTSQELTFEAVLLAPFTVLQSGSYSDTVQVTVHY